MTRRSKHNPALAGDRVRLKAEVRGRLEGQAYRALPGVEADVLEVRPEGDLVLRVGRNRATCLAVPTDVELVR